MRAVIADPDADGLEGFEYVLGEILIDIEATGDLSHLSKVLIPFKHLENLEIGASERTAGKLTFFKPMMNLKCLDLIHSANARDLLELLKFKPNFRLRADFDGTIEDADIFDGVGFLVPKLEHLNLTEPLKDSWFDEAENEFRTACMPFRLRNTTCMFRAEEFVVEPEATHHHRACFIRLHACLDVTTINWSASGRLLC